MKRKHRATSKEGEVFIKPFKQTHKQKILEALWRAKIGCTHEEAAAVAGMRSDQVWKRLSELCGDGLIFDTGITRKLKSGVHGIVWQLHGKKAMEVPDNPKTKAQQQAAKTLNQLKLL